jgi:antitoxin YefM
MAARSCTVSLYEHERRVTVAIHTTYTEARANLARLWDEATQSRETVIISRRGAEDIALIAADELASLQETAHLLRSPANAARLLSALRRSLDNETAPSSLDDLKHEVGLADEA